jgi:ligand-binding sensor domain-containing protein/signal transduction histidine kinase
MPFLLLSFHKVGVHKRPLTLSAILTLALAVIGSAHQLPVKNYTVADGLPSNNIQRIVADSRGYLWFCTLNGLSRFDGYSFKNYNTEQGLPSDDIRDLLITRSGQYWVATSKGVIHFHTEASQRLRPSSTSDRNSPRFEVYRLGSKGEGNSVHTLLEDRAGAIWAGTEAGLYRFHGDIATFRPADIGLPKDSWDATNVHAILEDGNGDLWIGTRRGLFRHRSNVRTERFTSREGLPNEWINRLFEDHRGRLWVGTRGKGLCLLVSKPLAHRPVVEGCYGLGLPDDRVRGVLEDSSGQLWVAGNSGLAQLPGTLRDSQLLHSYTEANGLSESDLTAIATDSAGNLWLGSASSGAMKIARHGFTTYGAADGLTLANPNSIFESLSGELLVVSHARKNEELALNRFDGSRFHRISPNFGPAVAYVGWARNQVALQAHTGHWWFVTGWSIRRFSSVTVDRLASSQPEAVYAAGNGFEMADIEHVFEDSQRNIWTASHSSLGKPPLLSGVSRWSPATGRFHHYTSGEMPTVEVRPNYVPTAFAEDRVGNVWIAVNHGVLVRYRDGQFVPLAFNGFKVGWIQALHASGSGRLWIGDLEYGLTSIENPSSDRPTFVHYGVAQGLASNVVLCITEDQFGRIYAGNGPGVDRLDPATGRIQHYSRSDGLVRGDVNMSFRDRTGVLWFGTSYGVSQFIPRLEPPPRAARVWLSAVRVRGIPRPISEIGETAVAGFSLASNQNQVQIDFSGLGFTPDDLSYQFMLEGSDPGWNPPTLQRTVNYASLSAGSYRFLVRAVNASGSTISAPASVAFQVLAPLWRRWWFCALMAAAALSLIHVAYRYRLSTLLALERIRLGIATDLHDDIGASLSQIALLSEVLVRQVGGNQSVRGSLEQIGALSRELVDSMSDIVWSVNPKRDTLGDLTQRMRSFASHDFPARDIVFEFRVSSENGDRKLSVEIRRQVFLIFKESVNNIVRHSGCSKAEIDFTVERERLELRLSDNGHGFDSQGAPSGHGLTSMINRARRLGGELQIASGPHGTSISLRASTVTRKPWGLRILHELVGYRARFRRMLKNR